MDHRQPFGRWRLRDTRRKMFEETAMKKKTPVACVMFFVPMLCIVSHAQAALTDNLVALYDLDETTGMSAADSIGSITGTLSGNFDGTEWTAGKVGGGLQFTRN
jgi:hypothetical protein